MYRAVFFLLAGSPVAGRLFDSHGPRLPLAVGSFMHVFGLMMTSLATRYYEFMLSQSICSGIGTSLIMTPALSAVSIRLSFDNVRTTANKK